MGDLLVEKIIARMKKHGELSQRAFTQEIAHVRFGSLDSKKIIEDMRRRGFLKINGRGEGRVLILIKKRVKSRG